MDVDSSKLEKLKSILRIEAAFYWQDVVAGLRMCGLGRFVSQENSQGFAGSDQPAFSTRNMYSKAADEAVLNSLRTKKSEADAMESLSSEAAESSSTNDTRSRLAQIVSARGKTPFRASRTSTSA